MTGFSFSAPDRSVFGRNTRAYAADEIASFGMRVLLVRGRSVPWVDDLIEALAAHGCRVSEVYAAGEPDLSAVRAATLQARVHSAECIVSVGGGAAIDLGKAVAGLSVSDGDPADYLELGPAAPLRLNTPLPFIAIPTTAGTGAEATRNAVIGVPERQAKISLRDPRLTPDLALVDPALTDGTPRPITLACGLDAITQLIESFLCNRANPVTDAICRSSIAPAISALDRLMQTEDRTARDALARAGYLSGVALANSGLGIIHGLASCIGGRGAPHGAICGRLLAAGLDANAMALKRRAADRSRIAEVDTWLAEGLGAPRGHGTAALRSFVDANGLPSMQDLGVGERDVGALAELARHASSTKANPVELEHSEICDLLGAA